MKERYQTPSAVMLILARERAGRKQILLQRRAHTGYMDGRWDCAASGHVEAGETMRAAMVREAMEELGIKIEEDDLRFMLFQHSHTREGGVTYGNLFFVAERFRGEARICEAEKCSELGWFPLNDLPDELIPSRRAAMEAILRGEYYQEWGWT